MKSVLTTATRETLQKSNSLRNVESNKLCSIALAISLLLSPIAKGSSEKEMGYPSPPASHRDNGIFQGYIEGNPATAILEPTESISLSATTTNTEMLATIKAVSQDLIAYFSSAHVKTILEQARGSFSLEKDAGYMSAEEGDFTRVKMFLTQENVGYFHLIIDEGKVNLYLKKINETASSEEVSELEYTTTLQRENNKARNVTQQDMVKFLQNINTSIVIYQTENRKRENAIAFFSTKEKKIYVQENCERITLGHEIIHSLVHNFPILWSSVLSKESEINEISNICFDRYKEHITRSAKVAEILVKMDDAVQKELGKGSANLSITKSGTWPSKTIDTNDIITNAAENIFSLEEFYVRIFDLRYACYLYLTPKVPLGAKITIENIEKLIDAPFPEVSATGSYEITDYIIYIDQEIESEKAKPNNQQDPKRILELQNERKKVIQTILFLMNNYLVYTPNDVEGINLQV